MERTLVLIKPDGVERGLIGRIITVFENKGLRIADMRMCKPSKSEAEEHYKEHKGKFFFQELIDYLTEDRIVAMILEGENATELVRKVNGDKDPLKAEGASIRGKYAIDRTRNLVHASDNPENVEREISIWFDCK